MIWVHSDGLYDCRISGIRLSRDGFRNTPCKNKSDQSPVISPCLGSMATLRRQVRA